MKSFLRKLPLFLCIIHAAVGQSDGTRIIISNDLELVNISHSVYLHISYSELPQYGRFPSNGMIVMSEGQAFLFDTPMTEILTKQLVSWLQDTMKIKIVGFTPNHWHDDCMAGLEYLQSIGVESYANEMTIHIAQAKHLPVPAHGFKDSIQLTVGEKEIRCY